MADVFASFLAEPGDAPFPPLPDDIDDLFQDELMQFLQSTEAGFTPAAAPAPAPCPAPAAVAALAAASAPAVSSETSSTCQSEGGSTSPSPVAPAPASCAPPAVPIMPSVGACSGVPRLVTTAAAQQMWTAMMLQAASQAATAPIAAPFSAAAILQQHQQQQKQQLEQAKARSQPVVTSRQGSHDYSGDSSDTDHDDDMVQSRGGKGSAGNKRKAPDVDWRAIEDPAERRRQRRLAKNRVTAARSRERKKAMWSELEEKLKSMESENSQLRAMLEQFARENASLKNQLLNITRAGAAAGLSSQAKTSRSTLAAVLIATLLVVCSLLPGDDKAAACLVSVLVPALVASALLGAADGSAGAVAPFDCLFRLLHAVHMLAGRGGRAIQRSFNSLLFKRSRFLGSTALRKLGSLPLADVLSRVYIPSPLDSPMQSESDPAEHSDALTVTPTGSVTVKAEPHAG